MSSGMIGADPVVLRQMAKHFDDAAHQLMGVKGAIQPWVDMTNIWLGLNYYLFKDMWEITGARTVVDAASIFYRCAEVLRANAEAQDLASAADGASFSGTGLFLAPRGVGGAPNKTPESTLEILETLNNQDPNSSDGIRIQVWEDENKQKHAIVYINGTKQDSVNDLFSWGDAILSQFGLPTETERKIRQTMTDAGIDKNTKLLIAGYSQGGMHAQNLAASGDFGDVVVLSQGSPRTLKNNGGFTHISLNHPADGVVNGVELVTAQGVKRVLPAGDTGSQYTHTQGAGPQKGLWVAAGSSLATGNSAMTASAVVGAGISAHKNMDQYKGIARDFDSSSNPRAVKAKTELKEFYNKQIRDDSK